MKKSTLKKLKRVIVISIILIGLIYLIAGPISSAAELPKKGEFYYAGTSKGSFVATENIFKWLFNILAEIIQFIFQLILFIIRMIFVGWAALISEALTGTFTAITGVKYDPSDVNPSNISRINVQDNITVEAIVFNKIPIFDVDFFNFEEMEPVTYTDADRKDPGKAIKTPTGKDLSDLRCTTCQRVESIGPHTFEQDEKKGICVCKVEECTCKACETRRNLMEPHDEFNPMEMIKTNVAEWYYTIRLMALVGMLLALGAIGIKMAISTVASDKAQYKQMLSSWVVGIILLFGIHYYMILMININNILVESVVEYSSESSKDIAEATMSDFGVSHSQSDMEVNLYEQARTRAYDPNLLNGLTGTILYCTLVYFSVRFAIVYFKRYFTIMILVLMAPGVAVTYAVQKAFSGRSHTLSLWLQEFCVNIVIQAIHALIYAAFLSTALRIAFDSLPGSILAFIILNFMLKALPIFRKIFKMSSDGGLLDDAMKAGSPERLKAMRDSAVGAALAAKPLAKSFSKLPGTQAVAGLVKAPVKIGVEAHRRRQMGALKKEQDEKMDQAKLDLKDIFAKNTETYGEGTDDELEEKANNTTNEDLKQKSIKQLRARRDAYSMRAIQGLPLSRIPVDNENVVASNQEDSANAITSAVAMQGATEEQILAAAKQDFMNRHGIEAKAVKPQSIVAVSAKNFARNIGMMTDFRNKYDILYDKDMHVHFKKRHIPKTQYNKNTGRYEETSAHKQMRELYSLRTALGASPAEMKALKTFLKDTTIGGLSFFTCMVGMGTVVAHPKIGLALLATGSQYVKLYAPNKTIRGVNKKRKNKAYAFYDYSPGATLAMGKIGSVEASIVRKEFETFIQNNQTRTIRDIDTHFNLGAVDPSMYEAEGQEGGEYATKYLNRKISELSAEEQMKLFFNTDFAKTLEASDIESAKEGAQAEFSKLLEEKYHGKVEDFLKAVNQTEKPDEMPKALEFGDKHFGKMAQGLDAIFEAEAKTAKQAQDAFVEDALLIASMQTASEFRKKLEKIKEEEQKKYEEQETELVFEGNEENGLDQKEAEARERMIKGFFGISVAVGDEEIVMDEPTIDETKIVKQAVFSTMGTKDDIAKLIKNSGSIGEVKGKAVKEIKNRIKDMGLSEDSPEVKRLFQELNSRVEQEIKTVIDQAQASGIGKKPSDEPETGKKVEPLLSEVPEKFNDEQFVKDFNDPNKPESKQKVNITEFEKKQLKDSLTKTIKDEIHADSKKTFGQVITQEDVKAKILEQYVKKTQGEKVTVESLSDAQKAFAEAQVDQFLSDVVEKSKGTTRQPGAPEPVVDQTVNTGTGVGSTDAGPEPVQTRRSPVQVTLKTRVDKKPDVVKNRMEDISEGFSNAAKAKGDDKAAAEQSLLEIFKQGEENEDPAVIRNQTQLALEAMILNSQLQKLNLATARYENSRNLDPISVKGDAMKAKKKQEARKAMSFLEEINKEENRELKENVPEAQMREKEDLYDEARLGYTANIVGMIEASLGKKEKK